MVVREIGLFLASCRIVVVAAAEAEAEAAVTLQSVLDSDLQIHYDKKVREIARRSKLPQKSNSVNDNSQRSC